MKLHTLVLLTLLPGVPLYAQQAPYPTLAGSNWRNVQALPLGIPIRVKARSRSATCALKTVDPDSLTCTHGTDTTFQRTEIRNLSVSHRGRSALIGTAIGAGTGAIVGAAGGGCPNGTGCYLGRPATAIIIAIPAGVIGAIVGLTTDFSHTLVYKAP